MKSLDRKIKRVIKTYRGIAKKRRLEFHEADFLLTLLEMTVFSNEPKQLELFINERGNH